MKWSSLEDAAKQAATESKPVFVMVYADWCGYCHKMDATTFRDPAIVAKLNGQFVPAKLNGESTKPISFFKKVMTESQWAQRQGVEGFPSLIVIDSKGRTVVQYPGYLETPTAALFLNDVGRFFKGGGIDKLGNFVDWAGKNRS